MLGQFNSVISIPKTTKICAAIGLYNIKHYHWKCFVLIISLDKSLSFYTQFAVLLVFLGISVLSLAILFHTFRFMLDGLDALLASIT